MYHLYNVHHDVVRTYVHTLNQDMIKWYDHNNIGIIIICNCLHKDKTVAMVNNKINNYYDVVVHTYIHST